MAGLDQYTRATLNAVFEGEGQCPHFKYQLRESQNAYLLQSLLLYLKSINIIVRTSQNSKISSQNGQNDLEGHGQCPPFSLPTVCIPRCMFGANLAILAQICDELSRGQTEFS